MSIDRYRIVRATVIAEPFAAGDAVDVVGGDDAAFVWAGREPVRIDVGGSCRWLTEGELVIVPGGSLLTSGGGTGAGTVVVRFGVEVPATRSILDAVWSRPFSAGGLEEVLCAELLRFAADPTPGAHARRSRLAGLLLDAVVEGRLGRTDSPDLPPVVDRVLDFVGATWCRDGIRPLPVPHISCAAAMSTSRLGEVFRRYLGHGVSEAFEIARVLRAAAMLRSTDRTIAEVSAELGWVNPFHFSRRFRVVMGSPPSRYRSAPTPSPAPCVDPRLHDLTQRLWQGWPIALGR